MKNTLECIKESNIVSTKFLETNFAKIQDNYNKKQIFRTETEMRISVLDDIHFPTRASKYWQAVREQSGMYETLLQESFEYRKKAIELEMKKDQLSKYEIGSYDYRILEVEIESDEFALESLRNTANDRLREIKLWQQIMDELDDGSFNTEDVNVHQLESYTEMFKRQAEVLGANGSPSENANLVGQLRTSQKYLNDGVESCTSLTQQIKNALEA